MVRKEGRKEGVNEGMERMGTDGSRTGESCSGSRKERREAEGRNERRTGKEGRDEWRVRQERLGRQPDRRGAQCAARPNRKRTHAHTHTNRHTETEKGTETDRETNRSNLSKQGSIKARAAAVAGEKTSGTARSALGAECFDSDSWAPGAGRRRTELAWSGSNNHGRRGGHAEERGIL
jgi:hypothetical protein